MWDCGSPLYDCYELVSLDHIIDRHLMAFPSSSSHGSSSKSIITRLTHHNDMVPYKVRISPEKSKGSLVVTNLSKFWVKIMRKKRKDNEEREKKNKEMARGFAGFVVDLLYFYGKLFHHMTCERIDCADNKCTELLYAFSLPLAIWNMMVEVRDPPHFLLHNMNPRTICSISELYILLSLTIIIVLTSGCYKQRLDSVSEILWIGEKQKYLFLSFHMITAFAFQNT
ncbi:hypothetical protein Fmac_010594 [Flemingia macrophylla]|uniref:Uncharacterized protein n=1 Tax=Flemingia macrophylla TaxID=520843 RepID=A0ABD1MK09_9FABA